MALIEIEWNPDVSKLRRFGLTAAVLLLGFALLVALRGRFLGMALSAGMAKAVSLGLAVPALACAALAWFASARLRVVFVGLSLAGMPIGFVVSHAVLALLYFGVITPVGLALRVLGRDPLTKGFDPKVESYWIRRGPPAAPESYFHQF